MESKNTRQPAGIDYGCPEKVILYLKKYHDRAIDLLLAYLDDLPVIEIAHSTRGSLQGRCDAWIAAVADLCKQRCADCAYKDACSYQCVDSLINALPLLCGSCRVSDRDECRKMKAARMNHLKADRRTFAEPYDGLKIYDCRLKFAKSEARYKGGSILTIPLPRYTPGANMGVAWPLKIQGHLHRWLKELDLAGNTDTELLDLVCSVVALTHLFLSDLYGKTKYMGLGMEASEPKNTGTNESSNVLLAWMNQGDGVSVDAIMQDLDENENQDEVLVGEEASGYTRSWVIDPAEAENLIDMVLGIYSCPVMPEFVLKQIDPQIKKKLDDLCRKGLLRKTNVKLTDTGVVNPAKIDARYLHYRIYLLLAALLGAAKSTRFTNRVALVFQGDNLIKIREYLREDEGHKLKDACNRCTNKGGRPLQASAVIQALDRYKESHPRYSEYMEKLAHDRKTHDTRELLAKSTLEEIMIWQERVNKLKT